MKGRPRTVLAGFLWLGLAVALPASIGAGLTEDEPQEAVEPATVERRIALMGTRLQLRVDAADRTAALRASERAMRALETTESRLSTWRPDTELARLNRAAPGEPVALSPELAAELEAAEACWRETSGAFDPALGALAAAWGLRTGGREPSENERRRAVAATGLDGLELQRATPEDPPRAVRHREGLVLDEGGFGKGAGLRAALTALEATEATSAALDLGGQWAFWTLSDEGLHEHLAGEPGWRVAVAHPRDRQRAVVVITVDGGSVATSGNSERAGHLLDPRDGRPATDFGSLTVWTSDPLRADCLSTGLYVLGPDAALAWAERHPGVEVLVLTVNGGGANEGEERLTAQATPGLEHRLEPLADGLAIEIRPGSRSARTDSTRHRNHKRTTTFKLPAIESSSPKSRAVSDRATPQEEYTCRF